MKLLEDLPEDELARLAKECAWKRYAPHEQIIDRHSESKDVCFIIEGGARVANFSLSGREITLDDLGAGAHFGELAAIDGSPRSASVVALGDCQIAMLPPDRFIALCSKHPHVAVQVMRSLTGIVRAATERIMDLSTLAANNRVHADLVRNLIHHGLYTKVPMGLGGCTEIAGHSPIGIHGVDRSLQVFTGITIHATDSA